MKLYICSLDVHQSHQTMYLSLERCTSLAIRSLPIDDGISSLGTRRGDMSYWEYITLNFYVWKYDEILLYWRICIQFVLFTKYFLSLIHSIKTKPHYWEVWTGSLCGNRDLTLSVYNCPYWLIYMYARFHNRIVAYIITWIYFFSELSNEPVN